MAVLPNLKKNNVYYDPAQRVTQGTNYQSNPVIVAGGGSNLNPTQTADSLFTSSYSNPFDKNSDYTFKSASPDYQDITNYLANFKTQLGNAPQISSGESLYSKFASKAPADVQGLGEDYYNSQRETRKEALRNEFFGPMGILNKQASSESARGGLGSGVGKVVLENTVTTPFAQQFGQIDRDVGQEQYQERARVQELNATRQDTYNQFLGKMAEADSSNALQASVANQELISKYDELAAKLAEAQAGNMNDYQIAQLEQEIKAAWDAEQSVIEREKLRLQEDEMKLQYAS